MPTAARERRAATDPLDGGPGRRGGVGPGARRPASDRSPQALVERGWLHAHISSYISGARRCSLSLLASRSPRQPRRLDRRPSPSGSRGSNETLLPATEVTTTTAPVVKDGNPADACTRHQRGGRAASWPSTGNWEGELVQRPSATRSKRSRRDATRLKPSAAGELLLVLLAEQQVVGSASARSNSSTGDSSAVRSPNASVRPEHARRRPTRSTSTAPAVAEAGVRDGHRHVLCQRDGRADACGGSHGHGRGASATTDPSGQADARRRPAPEMCVLQVNAPGSVRTETTVCVHNGNDGTCGTTGPSSRDGFRAPVAARRPTQARTRSLRKSRASSNSTSTRASDAPRVLSGTVIAHSAVASVSLELRRAYKGRCYAYDGVIQPLRRSALWQGSFFKVSTNAASPTCCRPRWRPGATCSTSRRPTRPATARRWRAAPRGSCSMSASARSAPYPRVMRPSARQGNRSSRSRRGPPPRRGVTRAALALAALLTVLAAAGCGLGAGPAPSAVS